MADKKDSNWLGQFETLPERAKLFLHVYSRSSSVLEACRKCKISRETVRWWLKGHPVKTLRWAKWMQVQNVPTGYHKKFEAEFQEAFRMAEEKRTAMLEELAYERAREGSDQLLMFLLRAAKPEKYRDKDSGPRVHGDVNVQVNALTPNAADLEKVLDLAKKLNIADEIIKMRIGKVEGKEKDKKSEVEETLKR